MDALTELEFGNLLMVWAAEAQAVYLKTPGPDGKLPAPAPDGHTDLRTLAAMQGFDVPPAPPEDGMNAGAGGGS